MRTLPAGFPLLDLVHELSFSTAQLQAQPLGASYAKEFEALLGATHKALLRQLELVTAQAVADAKVVRADDVLNQLVDQLSLTVLGLTGGEREHPLYQRFFGRQRPSEAKRPILGAQLELMRDWEATLLAAPQPELQALGTQLASAVKTADVAVEALRKAEQQRTDFAELGDFLLERHPAQQVVGAEVSGDFAEVVLRIAQVLGEQLGGGMVVERGEAGVHGVAAALQCVEVAAACGEVTGRHIVVTGEAFQVFAQIVDAGAGQRGYGDRGWCGARTDSRRKSGEIALVQHDAEWWQLPVFGAEQFLQQRVGLCFGGAVDDQQQVIAALLTAAERACAVDCFVVVIRGHCNSILFSEGLAA